MAPLHHHEPFLFASLFSSTYNADLHIIQISPTGTIFQIPWGVCFLPYLSPCSPHPLTASWRRDWLPRKSSSLTPLPTGLLSKSIRALTHLIHRTLPRPPFSCLLFGASDFLSETLSSSDFLKVVSTVSPLFLWPVIYYGFSASSSTQLVMGLSHSSRSLVFSVYFPSSFLWAWLLQWLTDGVYHRQLCHVAHVSATTLFMPLK